MPLPMLTISQNEPTSSARSASSRDAPHLALPTASASRPPTTQVSAVLKRPRRRDIAETTTAIRAALRSTQLAQQPQVTAGGAAVVRALAAVLTAPNEQITVLEGQVDTHFSPHPDAEIILSWTGTGTRTRRPVTSSGSRPTTARTRGPAG
jgi:hypothetical protein